MNCFLAIMLSLSSDQPPTPTHKQTEKKHSAFSSLLLNSGNVPYLALSLFDRKPIPVRNCLNVSSALRARPPICVTIFFPKMFPISTEKWYDQKYFPLLCRLPNPRIKSWPRLKTISLDPLDQGTTWCFWPLATYLYYWISFLSHLLSAEATPKEYNNKTS